MQANQLPNENTSPIEVATSSSHDIYGNNSKWNDWADWVNSNAAAGDIVAVASYDAIR